MASMPLLAVVSCTLFACVAAAAPAGAKNGACCLAPLPVPRDWLGSSRFAAGLVLPVLFLVSDDMRPSIGGHYALPEAHTPNLERLMDEGITFARAYIQYSYCSPSRNS